MRESYRSLRGTFDREMRQWDRRVRDTNNRRELLSQEGDLLRETLAGSSQTAEWLGGISSHINDQGNRLKGVQRTLLTMASTLGLSDSVIKMISRRTFMDRLLMFALMLMTLVVFFLCWRFL